MRILHVVPSYLPAWRYGGPIRSVHGLAKAQAALGHEVEAFTTDADGPGRLAVPTGRAVDRDGVAVRYFPLGRPARLYRSPAMGRALSARVREFDIVHLHSVFLWPTWAAARAARAAGVPYVVSPRGMLVGDLIRRRGAVRKRLWIRFVERSTLAGAGAILATSRVELEEIRRLKLDLAPVAVVPNGIEVADFDPVSGPEISPQVESLIRDPYVLYLGRVSWKKGLEPLLEAVALRPPVRLVIAGVDDEGQRPRLEALARSRGVEDRIRFAGPVHGPDRVALLRGARALALVSTSENFGNAVLEAMACGVPVVVSAGVGLADEVAAAGCGFVVDRAPAAIAEALGKLWENPQDARELGRRGRERVIQEFEWPTIAGRAVEAYIKVGAA